MRFYQYRPALQLLIWTTWLSCVHGFLHISFPLTRARHTIVTAAAEESSTSSISSSIPKPENLLSTLEFDRRCQIDAKLRALQVQLPLTLTKPLNAVSSRAIFDSNTRLAVKVDQDEIDLLNTRDELVALSDVLVLATSAANSVFGDATHVDCQIIIDPSCECIVIPWTAQVPILPVPGPSSSKNPRTNTFEGLSEFQFNSEGKIQKHLIRKVSWNDQSLNGPSIGQALKALQSTMTNFQNSPLWGLVGRNELWTDVRDGLLEQAATAASSRNKINGTKAVIVPVESIVNVTGWIRSNQTNLFQSSPIPLPGTDDWRAYVSSHESIINLCEQVIPLLSTTQDLSRYFTSNATLISTQGTQLLQGRDALSQFFQGLSLARRSTGGTWVLQKVHVLHWRSRKVAMDYVATNNPWTIRGQDIYTLHPESNQIQEIRQSKLEVTAPDGSVSLDGPWLMKNLALAVERSSNPTTIGPNIRDFFADVLFQQQQQQAGLSPSIQIQKRKISQMAAANSYYFMSELHDAIPGLWNATLPPGANNFDDTIELKGYLGETLLRGSTVYIRAMTSLLAATRQSLTQKRLLIDSDPRARVELTRKGKIRLSMMLAFRVPPPPGFPEAAAVPLTMEIVSDYTLDSQTGLVTQHKLVETRINGQLTPGDMLSRNLQRIWNLEQESQPKSNDDLLQSVADAVSWFRTLSKK